MRPTVIKQLLYDPDWAAFRRCDICDLSEHNGTDEFSALFEAAFEDEPGVIYTLCAECACVE